MAWFVKCWVTTKFSGQKLKNTGQRMMENIFIWNDIELNHTTAYVMITLHLLLCIHEKYKMENYGEARTARGYKILRHVGVAPTIKYLTFCPGFKVVGSLGTPTLPTVALSRSHAWHCCSLLGLAAAQTPIGLPSPKPQAVFIWTARLQVNPEDGATARPVVGNHAGEQQPRHPSCCQPTGRRREVGKSTHRKEKTKRKLPGLWLLIRLLDWLVVFALDLQASGT